MSSNLVCLRDLTKPLVQSKTIFKHRDRFIRLHFTRHFQQVLPTAGFACVEVSNPKRSQCSCHYELSNVHTRSWSYQGKEWRDAYCEEARIHFKVFKTGCRHQEPGYLCLESSPSPVPETTFQGNTTAKGWTEDMGTENSEILRVCHRQSSKYIRCK